MLIELLCRYSNPNRKTQNGSFTGTWHGINTIPINISTGAEIPCIEIVILKDLSNSVFSFCIL